MAALCVLACTALASSTSAQDASAQQSGAVPSDPVKAQDIRRLLDLTGSKAIGEQFWAQMFAEMKKAAPQVPESAWIEIDKEFSHDLRSGGLIEVVIAIYDKHFSADEIRQLIAFYESPIGRRLVAEQPLIIQESFAAGMQRGRELMDRIRERLKQKGYSVAIARTPSSTPSPERASAVRA
jgi:hypothetical protein